MNNIKTPIFLTLVLLMLTVPQVMAIPDYKTTFESTYTSAAESKIDSCLLCHTTAYGGPRNAYGLDYDTNSNSFSAIETMDSDSDGFTNIAEINAKTFPGDGTDQPAVLTTITVTPVTIEVTAGQTATLTANALDQNSQPIPVTLTWISAEPSIATVLYGEVTGVTSGTTTITASSGVVSGQATVTVNSVPTMVVTRSLDKTSIKTTDKIGVTVSGTGADFTLFMLTETIPAGFDVVDVSDNIQTSKNGDSYDFVGTGSATGFTATYSIKPTGSAVQGDYTVSGTYKNGIETDSVSGSITPDSTFKFIKSFEADCDTNNDHYIDKSEVTDAVAKYFSDDDITKTNIFTVIWDYFRQTYIEY